MGASKTPVYRAPHLDKLLAIADSIRFLILFLIISSLLHVGPVALAGVADNPVTTRQHDIHNPPQHVGPVALAGVADNPVTTRPKLTDKEAMLIKLKQERNSLEKKYRAEALNLAADSLKKKDTGLLESSNINLEFVEKAVREDVKPNYQIVKAGFITVKDLLLKNIDILQVSYLKSEILDLKTTQLSKYQAYFINLNKILVKNINCLERSISKEEALMSCNQHLKKILEGTYLDLQKQLKLNLDCSNKLLAIKDSNSDSIKSIIAEVETGVKKVEVLRSSKLN